MDSDNENNFLHSLKKKYKDEKIAKSIKIDKEVNNFIQKIIEEDTDVSYSFLVNSLLKESINHIEKGIMMIDKVLEKQVKVWVMGCKYKDGEEDLFQDYVDENKIILGWRYNIEPKPITTIEEVKDKGLRDAYFCEKKFDNYDKARSAHTIMVDKMDIGDYVILRKGISAIHAIVKVLSKVEISTEGRAYRNIEIIKTFKTDSDKKQALENYKTYFDRSLGMGNTIYPLKEKDSKKFWAFILKSIQA